MTALGLSATRERILKLRVERNALEVRRARAVDVAIDATSDNAKGEADEAVRVIRDRLDDNRGRMDMLETRLAGLTVERFETTKTTAR